MSKSGKFRITDLIVDQQNKMFCNQLIEHPNGDGYEANVLNMMLVNHDYRGLLGAACECAMCKNLRFFEFIANQRPSNLSKNNYY